MTLLILSPTGSQIINTKDTKTLPRSTGESVNAARLSAEMASLSAEMASLSAEMGCAAMETIQARTQMMQAAWQRPENFANAEFTRMFVEKIEAFSRSGVLMNGAMQQAGYGVTQWMHSHTMLASSATTDYGRCRSPMEFMSAWSKWFSQAQQANVNLFVELSSITVRAGEQGLRPVHRKAIDNARRLRRR